MAPSKREEHLVDRLNWVISAHAIDRYIGCVRRGAPRTVAMQELAEMIASAHFVKELPSGIEYWRGPKPRRLRLRVKRGNPMILETVLFTFDR
jgi:hypothetical protein